MFGLSTSVPGRKLLLYKIFYLFLYYYGVFFIFFSMTVPPMSDCSINNTKDFFWIILHSVKYFRLLSRKKKKGL